MLLQKLKKKSTKILNKSQLNTSNSTILFILFKYISCQNNLLQKDCIIEIQVLLNLLHKCIQCFSLLYHLNVLNCPRCVMFSRCQEASTKVTWQMSAHISVISIHSPVISICSIFTLSRQSLRGKPSEVQHLEEIQPKSPGIFRSEHICTLSTEASA